MYRAQTVEKGCEAPGRHNHPPGGPYYGDGYTQKKGVHTESQEGQAWATWREQPLSSSKLPYVYPRSEYQLNSVSHTPEEKGETIWADQVLSKYIERVAFQEASSV